MSSRGRRKRRTNEEREDASGRLGRGEPRHRFVLNPYDDVRFTTCPRCSGKTLLRKFPLFIHVDPMQLIALHKSCRYCPHCDLVIAHRDEIEQQLTAMSARGGENVTDSDYLVIGTLDRPVWRKGRKEPLTIQEAFDNLHDWQEVLTVQVDPGGWRPA